MTCSLLEGGANHPGWWDGPDRYHNINRSEVAQIQRDTFFKTIEVLTGGIGVDIGAGNTKLGNVLRLDIHSSGDIIGRGEMLPLKNESIDYIFSCHSLEHIPDTENTLKDWMRVLKQGGIMAVVMPDKRYFTHDHNVTTDGETARNEATPGEILAILKRLPDAKILLFNTRNNNFDFEFLIKKERIL